MTPLTAAHRSWRTKVFATTWLSYVGFYFCRKPFSASKHAIQDETGWSTQTLANIYVAFVVAYAIGQFLASRMGPRLGPRRNVLLGSVLSIFVTIAMGFTLDPWLWIGLIAVNGLAQATGWSGNVGTMAHWFHKHERGKVMGLWSTNFTVGALATAFGFAWVLSMHDPGAPKAWRWSFFVDAGEPEPWRWTFFVGAAVFGLITMQYYMFQRTRPEDVGLVPIDDPVTAIDEATTPDPVATGPMGLSRSAWTNLLLIGGFYFCAKLIRYAVWSWAPYFLNTSYGLSGAKANAYSTVFEVAGLAGAYVTGWLSDRYFSSRRSEVSLLMMVGMMAVTGVMVLSNDVSLEVFAVMLAAVGFTLYGPDALLSGAGSIDVGGRRAATFATAMISGIGSLGPVVQELVIARLYDPKSGDLGPIFVLLFGSAALGAAFCLALALRNRAGGKGI